MSMKARTFAEISRDAAVDDLDRRGRRLVPGQHRLEPTGADSVGDLIGEHHGQATAALGVAGRGVGAVGHEGRTDRDPLFGAVADEAPLGRGGDRGELDDRVRGEVGGCARALPLRASVVGAAHDDPARLADDARAEAGVVEVADSHGHVDALVDEVDHPVRERELADHGGVAGEELAHQRRHLTPAECAGRRDDEPAHGLAVLGARGPLGLVDGREDPARALEVARARVGERHRAGGPLEQADGEALLERGAEAGDGGPRGAEAARGGGEPAQLGDGDEGGHGVEAVHRRSLQQTEW